MAAHVARAPGAPWHQVWAAPMLLAVIAATGLAYLAVAKPHRAAG